MQKYQIEPVTIETLKQQLMSNQLSIFNIDCDSQRTCDSCNYPFNFYTKINGISVLFRTKGNGSLRELCINCVKNINKYLMKCIIKYIKYTKEIIKTENLSKIPPHKIQNLIKSGLIYYYEYFDKDLANLIFNTSNEYKILLKTRPNILFEDLANINIDLLKAVSLGDQFLQKNNLYGYHICLCGRYYHNIFGLRKQCLECYFDFGNPDDIYYELRNDIVSSAKNYSSLMKICLLNQGIYIYNKYECSICYKDNVKYIFIFDCGHSICYTCSVTMRSEKNNQCIIDCPFCRYSHNLIKSNMISWSKHYISIKCDLEKSVMNGKCISSTIQEKCKYQSEFIIQQMMKKQNLPVYQYLQKLENMNLLGWCDHFVDGLLNNQ